MVALAPDGARRALSSAGKQHRQNDYHTQAHAHPGRYAQHAVALYAGGGIGPALWKKPAPTKGEERSRLALAQAAPARGENSLAAASAEKTTRPNQREKNPLGKTWWQAAK